MDFNLKAFKVGTADPVSVRATKDGDLRVVPALPPKAELVRLGCGWEARIATASAFTYVNALPTTRAEIMLYNGEPAGGKSYVVDSAWMFGITSMAAAQPIVLIAQLVPSSTMVAPTHSATTTILNSLSGKANYSGYAKRAVAVTTCFTDLWSVVAQGLVPAPTTNLAASVYGDLFGKYVVPPGAGFGLAGVAGTAAGTAIIGVAWYEVQLELA